MTTTVAKPTVLPDWATGTNYTVGTYAGQTTKSAPAAGTVTEGFNGGYPLPAEWLNYMLNNHGAWLDFHEYQRQASRVGVNWMTILAGTPALPATAGDFYITESGTGGVLTIIAPTATYNAPMAKAVVNGAARSINGFTNGTVQVPAFMQATYVADFVMSANGANNLTLNVGMTDVLPISAASHSIAFKKASGDTNWLCLTSDGGTLTTSSSGVAGSTSIVELRIDVFGSGFAGGNRADFYIDGTLVASNATHLPGATGISPMWYVLNTSGGANANTASIGNVSFQWSRVA